MLGKDIRFIGNNKINKAYIGNTKIFELNNTPGPSDLIAGNMEAGFYGEVPASDFVTGDEFCSLVGITEGTSIYSDEPWLKFSYLGETVFVAKKPIRHSTSWDHINAAGCVFGEKIVTIKGQSYKVTLLKGKTEGKQNDTSSRNGPINHNSMWNKLMGQVHYRSPSSWKVPNNMESTLVNWGINYTDADLLTNKYNWCQEYGTGTGYHLVRGSSTGVSDSSHAANKTKDAYYQYRPALILVP